MKIESYILLSTLGAATQGVQPSLVQEYPFTAGQKENVNGTVSLGYVGVALPFVLLRIIRGWELC